MKNVFTSSATRHLDDIYAEGREVTPHVKNANARLYDPVTSTFLSVDNYVQDPSYTQNFNRYAYCLNNPLKYTDPDGEWAHLVIGALVGGIVNLATNWGHINTFGEGLAYFGIGAAAGALSAGVGLGVSSWIGGGSFGAGFIGSVTAKTAVSSFASGSVIGGSTGFTQGFIIGSGNSWMQDETFGQGLLHGVYSGVAGLVNGAIHGGIQGGMDAVANGRRFWSGDSVKTFSRDYPTGPSYCQSGDDCAITAGKTIYDYDNNSNITSSQISADCNNGVCGPVQDANYWSKFGDKYNYRVNQLSRLPDSELARPSIPSLIDDFNNGSHVALSVSENSSDMTHTVLVRKTETRFHTTWGKNASCNITNKIWYQDPRTGYLNGNPIINTSRIINAFIIRK